MGVWLGVVGVTALPTPTSHNTTQQKPPPPLSTVGACPEVALLSGGGGGVGLGLIEAEAVSGPRSYEDLGERVGAGAGDEALGGVECHVVDGLLELLAVGGELLDAGLVLQTPQADRAVVAFGRADREKDQLKFNIQTTARSC